MGLYSKNGKENGHEYNEVCRGRCRYTGICESEWKRKLKVLYLS